MRFYISFLIVALYFVSCTHQDNKSNESEAILLSDTSQSISIVDSIHIDPLAKKREKFRKVNRYFFALDTLLLYEDTIADALVVDTIYLLEPFYASVMQVNYGIKEEYFARVISYHNAKLGWLKIQRHGVRYLHANIYDKSPLNTYLKNPLFFICNYLSSIHINQIEVLDHLLTTYPPGHVINHVFDDYRYYTVDPVWSDKLIYEKFAQYYESEEKDFQKAEEYYLRVLNDRHKHKEYDRTIRSQLLNVYRSTEQSEKLERLAFSIIKNDPKGLLEYFESNEWIDIKAAGNLIYPHIDSSYHANQLVENCQKILAISKDTAVQLLAHSGLVYHHIREGELLNAIGIVARCQKRYNSHQRRYFKSSLDYGMLPAVTLMDYVQYELNDPSQAIALNRKLLKLPIKDSLLRKGYQYRLADKLSVWNGNIYEIDSLRELSRNYLQGDDVITGFTSYHYRKYGTTYLMRPMYEAEPEERDTFRVKENTLLKYGLQVDSMHTFTASEGEIVTLQDRTRIRTEGNRSGFWAKVINQNDSIYWVFSADLIPLNERPLFQKELSNNLLKLDSNSIFREVDRFKNVGFYKNDFVIDCNDDGYLDHLQHGRKAYNGKDKTLLWAINRSPSISGLFADSVFFGIDDRVHAYSRRTGQPLWTTMVSDYQRRLYAHNTKNLFVARKQEKYNYYFISMLDADGQVRQNFKVNGKITRLQCNNQYLFVASEVEENVYHLFQIDLTNDFLTYKYAFAVPILDVFIARENDLFVALANDKTVRINIDNREKMWETLFYWTDSPYRNKLSFVSDSLVISGEGWRLQGFDARTGKRLWHHSGMNFLIHTENYLVTYGNHYLYILDQEGTIHQKIYVDKVSIRESYVVGDKVYVGLSNSELVIFELN